MTGHQKKMDENISLLLNVTTETGKRRTDSNFQKNEESSTPLVKFVSKPKTISSDGQVRKPVFRVLRKKASALKLDEPKSLANVTFTKDMPDDKPSPRTHEMKKTLPLKHPRRKTLKSKPEKKPLVQKWTVSDKEQPKPPSVQNSTIISSLFRKNPEIPALEKPSVTSTKENVFSVQKFSDLSIHPHLVATLEKDLQLELMTESQSSAIPLLLEKKDILVKSQTGSGKTLAYAVPIVERLQRISPKIDRGSGVLALVIVPTRELVLQTYTWFVKILKPFTWVVAGYLMGGEKKKSEKARIRKGVNILISTPGRLLDHLSSTKNLNLGRLQWLVMDEADRLLDMGYEKDVAKILELVKEHFDKEGGIGQRQTVLLSATLSPGVEKLAGLTLNDPQLVNMNDESSSEGPSHQHLVVPSNLKQSYIIVPAKLRLVTLAAFMLWKCKKSDQRKMLIFMTTQDMVDYHAELFNLVLSQRDESAKLNFYKLHGSMAQKDRMTIFKEFRDVPAGILLCTDVAARGLDLPKVDWIVQYNPPVTAEDYVHRVGRTARVGQCGEALIFLSPSETEFVTKLGQRGIALSQLDPDTVLKTLVQTFSRLQRTSMEESATALQLAFEECVDQSFNLYQTATKGYVSFIRSYAALPKDVRDVFNFKSLHLGHYAKSFALRDPPKQINSRGRPGMRDDKSKPFNTAFQRNPAKKRPAGGRATVGTFRYGEVDGGESKHQPTFKERRDMMSEFASGLDYRPPPPTKKAKKSATFQK